MSSARKQVGLFLSEEEVQRLETLAGKGSVATVITVLVRKYLDERPVEINRKVVEAHAKHRARLAGHMKEQATATAMRILRALVGDPRIPVGELSEKIHADPATIQRAFGTLEVRGLIDRESRKRTVNAAGLQALAEWDARLEQARADRER